MSRHPENFSFEHINPENDLETDKLANKFEDAESIPAEEIKEYARHIAKIVLETDDFQKQKVVLIDLLNDSMIAEMVNNAVIREMPDFKKTDDFYDYFEKTTGEIQEQTLETDKMAHFAVKEIKKKIIEELKKYIPKELYFFIKNYIEPDPKHINQKSIVTDSEFVESFLKETKLSNSRPTIKELQNNLETLSQAFKKLSKSDTQMPYVTNPEFIEEPTIDLNDLRSRVGYTTTKKDLVTLDEIFFDEQKDTNFSIKDALLAFVDCMRGAKFLVENNLTLTDIYTIYPGKNLGLDKKTKKGILFDLDGLQKIGNHMHAIVGPIAPKEEINELLTFYPPEYRKIVETRESVEATAKSMTWEFGNTLLAFEKLQSQKSNKINNYHVDEINGWKKINKLAGQMIAENQILRPSLDNCITELSEIIKKYF